MTRNCCVYHPAQWCLWLKSVAVYVMINFGLDAHLHIKKRRHGWGSKSNKQTYREFKQTKIFRLEKDGWGTGSNQPQEGELPPWDWRLQSSSLQVQIHNRCLSWKNFLSANPFAGWRNLSLLWNRFCLRLRWAHTTQRHNLNIQLFLILGIIQCAIWKPETDQPTNWLG